MVHSIRRELWNGMASKRAAEPSSLQKHTSAGLTMVKTTFGPDFEFEIVRRGLDV